MKPSQFSSARQMSRWGACMRMRHQRNLDAFTLLELLTVLVIIGILAAIALPSIKGIGRSNILASANRQLLDDLAFARQRAINEHTVVHVVFVPPPSIMGTIKATVNAGRDAATYADLLGGSYTTYAMFSERTVGDQPGRPFYRYLTDWKTLPDGVFIPDWKYDPTISAPAWFAMPAVDRPFQYASLPFPSVEGNPVNVPHIAFGPDGGLRRLDQNGDPFLESEYLSLARGSVMTFRNPDGSVDTDAVERPPNNSKDNYNRIRIDALTGRAAVERPEIR